MSTHDKKYIFINRIATIILTLSILISQFSNLSVINALEYNRAAVLSGEIWRLFTGNLIHLGFTHAFMDASALVFFHVVYSHKYSWQIWLNLLLSIPIATSILILLFFPNVEWFAGYSGALHGLFICGSFLELKDKKPEQIFIFIFVLAKVVYEQMFGSISSHLGLLSGSVLTESHTAGLVAGLIFALIIEKNKGQKLRPLF